MEYAQGDFGVPEGKPQKPRSEILYWNVGRVIAVENVNVSPTR